MELHIHDAVGIPQGSELCVRVGGTRRQVYLDNLAKPLKFPCKPEEIKTIKIDVLTPISHIRIPFDAATKKYQVVLDADDHTNLLGEVELQDMHVSFDVNPASNVDPSFLGQHDPPSQRPSDQLNPETLNSSVYRHRREMESQSYMEEYGLVTLMQYLVHGLMQEKPRDPKSFLKKQIDMKYDSQLLTSGYPKSASLQASRAGSKRGVRPEAVSHASRPQDEDLEKLLEKTAKVNESAAPEEVIKLELEALEASEHLRKQNAKLRETAEELKSEYEVLIKETNELQAAKNAKALSRLPGKAAPPPIQETAVQQEPLDVGQVANKESQPAAQERPRDMARDTVSKEVVSEVANEKMPAPVQKGPSQEEPVDVTPAPVQERRKSASRKAPEASPEGSCKFALEHESLMAKTAPLLVKKDAWKSVEPVQDVVGSIAQENDQLVAELLKMRQMIKVLRDDFREIEATLDEEGVA